MRNDIHWRAYGLAFSAVCGTVLLAWLLQPYVSLPNLVLLFVLTAVAVAFWVGRGPALLASVMGGLGYAILYVPWAFIDQVEAGQYIITFAITVLLSLFISHLATSWRVQALASERHAAEIDRLYRYARELETEKLRNSVLSALSHDLRTPLAGLVGASSSLLSSELSLNDGAKQDLAQLIYDEAQRMQVLVENLLELARLEAGPVRLQQDWQALDEIVGATLSVWRAALAPRQVHLNMPADLPMLRFDPRLIERVLVNLLDNCRKYTPETAHIVIEAQAFAEEVRLLVRDDGPGFQGDPQQLFQKFYRGDSSGHAPGAGLGLAICRAIVEAHGGRISAQRVTPQGAQFTVTLPRSAEPDLESELDDEH